MKMRTFVNERMDRGERYSLITRSRSKERHIMLRKRMTRDTSGELAPIELLRTFSLSWLASLKSSYMTRTMKLRRSSFSVRRYSRMWIIRPGMKGPFDHSMGLSIKDVLC